MERQKNTPHLWDNFWKQKSNRTSLEADLFHLAREESSIRWQRIERIVLENFGSFKGLNVIEIGAGTGKNAALMAIRGSHVTILDYSENALISARQLFQGHGVTAEFIHQDALSLDQKRFGKYDISMSFGLAEHFTGAEREKIIKTHFDVLSTNGITFISVPNRYNIPYRIRKFVGEIFGIWKVGEEYPFSRKELKGICQKVDANCISFFGDSIYSSLQLINPFKVMNKRLPIKNRDLRKIRNEKGSFLDQYFSYALVLYGKK